jgi:hypothetical protein
MSHGVDGDAIDALPHLLRARFLAALSFVYAPFHLQYNKYNKGRVIIYNPSIYFILKNLTVYLGVRKNLADDFFFARDEDDKTFCVRRVDNQTLSIRKVDVCP